MQDLTESGVYVDDLRDLCDWLGVNFYNFGNNQAGVAAAAMSVRPSLIYRDLPTHILRLICQRRRLKTGGNKSDLVKRLFDAGA
jgi:hypothetical protein